MTINHSEINRKSTLEIGDRVLAHNGSTGYIVEMSETTVVIETKHGRVTSPRDAVLTTEIESVQ